jgi:hypothetical protein
MTGWLSHTVRVWPRKVAAPRELPLGVTTPVVNGLLNVVKGVSPPFVEDVYAVLAENPELGEKPTALLLICRGA